MHRCFLKRQLKKLPVYKLQFIAKKWGIRGFRRHHKVVLVELIFDHRKNRSLRNVIDLSGVKRREPLETLEKSTVKTRQKKKGKRKRKLRKEKVNSKKNRKGKRKKKSAKKCHYCCVKRIDCYFSPCGHNDCCMLCANRMLGLDSRCPMCKEEVKTLTLWQTKERITITPKRLAISPGIIPETFDFQPDFTQQCDECGRTGNESNMLDCEACAKVYHENCYLAHQCECETESDSSEFLLDLEHEETDQETEEKLEPPQKRRKVNIEL